MDFIIIEAPPGVDEYCALRTKCGLAPRSEESARVGLPRALYSVTLRSGEKLIAMGRVVGDLGCHVQITDIAVDQEFQGQGLGRMVMERIMSFIHQNVPRTCFVNLFADVDFLYQKFGFVQTTKAKGMYLDWTTVDSR